MVLCLVLPYCHVRYRRFGIPGLRVVLHPEDGGAAARHHSAVEHGQGSWWVLVVWQHSPFVTQYSRADVYRRKEEEE